MNKTIRYKNSYKKYVSDPYKTKNGWIFRIVYSNGESISFTSTPFKTENEASEKVKEARKS